MWETDVVVEQNIDLTDFDGVVMSKFPSITIQYTFDRAESTQGRSNPMRIVVNADHRNGLFGAMKLPVYFDSAWATVKSIKTHPDVKAALFKANGPDVQFSTIRSSQCQDCEKKMATHHETRPPFEGR